MGTINKKTQRELYTLLLKARRVEEKLIQLSTNGEMAGWIHAMLGHEAVGVGVTANLERKDLVNYTHRGRAIMIGKGASLKRFMAEALGKETGPCGGRMGEGHYGDLEYGILGCLGCLGASIAVCVGAALAFQYRNAGQVVINFFGDGTVDEGNFHESLNIASLWKLPIVFIVENNGWAQFTPQEVTAAQPEIWRKAESYKIPSLRADGNDLDEIYKTSRDAIAKARRGEGPVLIEYMCHRWLGHYVGDPQKYRAPNDIEEAVKNDPLKKYQERLIAKGKLNFKEIEKLESEIKAEIEDAIQFAKGCPEPTSEQAFKMVYA
jgi:TPP-dependent pyruvate/acetoin dehydrogenase alpha subunit